MQADFFEANRQRLLHSVKGGVVVLAAYAAMQRGNDASFMFEQEASFWWLSGIERPDWWIIIDGNRQKTWLVRPMVSDIHQVFDGSLSDQEALAMSGAKEVLSRDDAMKLLRDLAQHHSVVYSIGESPYADHYDFVVNPAQKKLWATLDRVFNSVTDCQQDIAQLRAIKQPLEIKAMQQAINLTIEAFQEVKSHLADYRYEYEIEADFTHHFRKHGAVGHAYDPIVASGKNACTLHYHENQMKLRRPGLVLMDIGARYQGYAADITRTYAVPAVNRSVSQRQKAVHAAVRHAHERIIALLRPGLALGEYLRQVDEIMQEALRSLDLLQSIDDYRRYFPHAISHGLGVDVHDSLGRPYELQSGMVLTVEPGIYIPDEGIGVRIEDDILITDTGSRNLSQKLSTEL